ncbi:cathelicidin-2-like [Excalfactoria chinensis]|uniref:cathelicidin-2-like n=1 Tax=Excalfactoria chinensis TaxID=46218 RepID=UPI003B3A819D
MLSCWALLLALLGGVCALPAPLSYPQALIQAVDTYNKQPEVKNAFRLLSADPEPGPGIDLNTLRELKFTIMETECVPTARTPIDDCDFKENGAIKDCSGPVTILQDAPVINLNCRDASSDPVLVQRGRFGRFLKKVRRFIPNIILATNVASRFG